MRRQWYGVVTSACVNDRHRVVGLHRSWLRVDSRKGEAVYNRKGVVGRRQWRRRWRPRQRRQRLRYDNHGSDHENEDTADLHRCHYSVIRLGIPRNSPCIESLSIAKCTQSRATAYISATRWRGELLLCCWGCYI